MCVYIYTMIYDYIQYIYIYTYPIISLNSWPFFFAY